MRIFALIIFGMLLIACRNSSPEDTKLKAEKIENEKISVEQLAGKWYLNKNNYFRTIEFKNDTIFVYNKAGNCFRVNFVISNDTLITWPIGGPGKNIKNKMLLVTKGTLIFESLFASLKEFHYSRIKR